MGVHFHIYSVSVPRGTVFPCAVADARIVTISDEERFFHRLTSWPGVTLEGIPALGYNVWRGARLIGQLYLGRRLSHEFIRDRMAPTACNEDSALERLRGLLEEAQRFPLIGVGLRADPRDVLELYRHLKAEFPQLLITWDEARVYCDEEAFERQIETWERGEGELTLGPR